MKLFKLSPAFLSKWQKLRKNKRSYISLIIFSIMFLFSLPSELIFNDKPLMVNIDGKYYFPAFRFNDYTWNEIGGNTNTKVADFKGNAWRDFVNNRQVDTKKMAISIFGEVGPNAYDTNIIEDAKPRKVSYLWPLIPHDYQSSLEIPSVERSRTTLLPPWNFTNKTLGANDPKDERVAIKEIGSYKDKNWLGTDSNGKDILARLVYGFRISIFFGLGLTFVGAIIGTFLGALQGFFGGLVDMFGQRLIEIWGSIPQLYVLMILSSFLAAKAELSPIKQAFVLFIILSSTSWMGISSYMRAEFLRARNLEYVKAARALGQSDFKIMLRHILPNSLTPLITFLPFNISAGMLALTSLDFLGLGLKYPAPSLGELLKQGETHMDAFWILIPTFMTISISLLLLNFIGEGLREAFDPRSK